jgi:hypothetical protein
MKICPLSKLITYSKSCTEDLELIFNTVDSLSTVPSGPHQVLERVLAFSLGSLAKPFAVQQAVHQCISR